MWDPARAKRLQAAEDRRVEFGGHRRVAAQPGIDILVGRIEQRLELVEFGLVQAGQMFGREGAEDQIDLLEAAALRAEQ